MGAKNRVIAGDYLNRIVVSVMGSISLNKGFNAIALTKENVEAYEVITDEQRKSAASGITRGLVGGALLGPVGLLAGLSAKNKGVYTVAILFKDGQRSLLEIDDKCYKALIKSMF